jgi:hypothetical protein
VGLVEFDDIIILFCDTTKDLTSVRPWQLQEVVKISMPNPSPQVVCPELVDLMT